MNRKNDIGIESDLLDELRFSPSRGAPPGAALRVEERLQRTIAELDEMGDAERMVLGGHKSRTRFRGFPVGRASLVGAVLFAILLTGFAWAAFQAMIAHRMPPPVEIVDRAAAPIGPSLDSASSPSVANDPSAVSTSPKTPPPPGASTAITSNRNVPRTTAASSDLVAERALLDPARQAFGNGQYADAEQMLDTHAHRFPAGLLAEEREALIVRTLAAEGRPEEARARAARFHARFPRSFFGSAVDNGLRANP